MKKGLVLLITLLISISSVSVIAKAEAQTPLGEHRYKSKKVTYHSTSKSKYYNEIWNTAAKEWRKTKVISISKKQNKKGSTMYVGTHNEKTADWVGLTRSWYWTDSYYTAETRLYLNRYYHNYKPKYYNKKRLIGTAIHEYGHAMGIAHNKKNKKSVMWPSVEEFIPSKVPAVDKRAMKKRYQTAQKKPKKGKKSKQQKLEATWSTDYSSIKKLTKTSNLIVDGYVTASTNADQKTDDGTKLPYTKQKFRITAVQKGNKQLKNKHIQILQLGNSKVDLEESIILKKGQRVRVVLRYDSKNNYHLINEGTSIFIKPKKNANSMLANMYQQVSTNKRYFPNEIK